MVPIPKEARRAIYGVLMFAAGLLIWLMLYGRRAPRS